MGKITSVASALWSRIARLCDISSAGLRRHPAPHPHNKVPHERAMRPPTTKSKSVVSQRDLNQHLNQQWKGLLIEEPLPVARGVRLQSAYDRVRLCPPGRRCSADPHAVGLAHCCAVPSEDPRAYDGHVVAPPAQRLDCCFGKARLEYQPGRRRVLGRERSRTVVDLEERRVDRSLQPGAPHDP
jgi:hypothetical protein